VYLLLKCKYSRNELSFKGSTAQSYTLGFRKKRMLFSPDAAENPETGKLVFAAGKERPTEAPFGAWKNSFPVEDLERKRD
jgi:hypothetical protein